MRFKVIKKIPLIMVIVILFSSISVQVLSSNNIFDTEPSVINLTSNTTDLAEFLPGMFVSYYLQTDYDYYNETYMSEWDYENDTIPDLDNQSNNYYYPFILEVFANNGTPYYIYINETDYWEGYTNLTVFSVEIFVDLDGNLIESNDSSTSHFQNDSYSGDEVYYTTDFFMLNWGYNYTVIEEYEWFNFEGDRVQPADVIPILAVGYEWASFYNESFYWEDQGDYFSFGYMVDQMTLFNANGSDFEILETQSFFEGFSIFNDTNSNGIIDMDYDAGFFEPVLSESELVYDVWFESAIIEKIEVPRVENNSILWSVRLKDMTMELWDTGTFFTEMDPLWWETNTSEFLLSHLPYLEFDFSFSIEDSLAVLKVDQMFGEFQDPNTGIVSSELQGLSLAVNYWLSIFHLSSSGYNVSLSENDSSMGMSEQNEISSSSIWNDDITVELSSKDLTSNITPTSIDFGGLYELGHNRSQLNVNTVLLPSYGLGEDIYNQAGVSNEFFAGDYMAIFYYSSCYPLWNGLSISHDPLFISEIPDLREIIERVFPMALFFGIMVTTVLVVSNLLAIVVRLKRGR